MTAGFAPQAAQTVATGITAPMRTPASIETEVCGMNSPRFHNRPDAKRFPLEEELRTLRERLVHAHEQERVRVSTAARRMAALSGSLVRGRRECLDGPRGARSRATMPA